MIEFCIQVRKKTGEILAAKKAVDECYLVYDHFYEPGDEIVIQSTQKDIYTIVSLDDAMGNAFTYLKTNQLVYQIPFAEKKISYSPKAFYGEKHLISINVATEEEIKNYKNLACNVYDQHGEPGLFPHAFANVETRGESVFAARNAIDGNRANHSHGEWPYTSWGINMQDDAWITLDFGRNVKVDKIVLYTRADFPHDNWWANVTLTFSDGSQMKWDLKKSDKAHVIIFKEKTISCVKLSNLIKSEDPSPFPALSQLEVYGRDV